MELRADFSFKSRASSSYFWCSSFDACFCTSQFCQWCILLHDIWQTALCFCCSRCWLFSVYCMWCVCLSVRRLSRPRSRWHLARMAQERVCVAMAMMEKLNLCLPHPQPGRFQAICISSTKRALSSRKEPLNAAPSWLNHLNASLWLKITNMSWKMWQPTTLPCQVFQCKSESCLHLQLLWFMGPYETIYDCDSQWGLWDWEEGLPWGTKYMISIFENEKLSSVMWPIPVPRCRAGL